MLGRDDGSIEVYPIKGINELTGEPIGKASAGEAITGLDVGPIRDPGI